MGDTTRCYLPNK